MSQINWNYLAGMWPFLLTSCKSLSLIELSNPLARTIKSWIRWHSSSFKIFGFCPKTLRPSSQFQFLQLFCKGAKIFEIRVLSGTLLSAFGYCLIVLLNCRKINWLWALSWFGNFALSFCWIVEKLGSSLPSPILSLSSMSSPLSWAKSSGRIIYWGSLQWAFFTGLNLFQLQFIFIFCIGTFIFLTIIILA